MRVLPAVLANAWNVALDIARIEDSFVEWRIEQQDELIVLADESLLDGRQRFASAPRIRDAGDRCPGFRPRRRRALDRRPIPAQRGVPDLDGVCRLLPAGIGAAGCGHGGMSLKFAAPLLLGVLMLALWEAVVRAAAIRRDSWVAK